MTVMRVVIELEVDIQDAAALQEAAAEAVYAIQRDAAKAGREITSDSSQEDMIEDAAQSDVAALAHVLQLGLPYKEGWPGCHLGHSDVRVQLQDDPEQEARVRGRRA